jgi:uncharacterized membrane protein YedE/YeeE
MSVLEPLSGGILIGLGSLLAMVASGKVPGISGVVAKTLRPKRGDVAWRVIFLVGIIAGAALAFALHGPWKAYTLPAGRGVIGLAIAGLLVGFGTRMGGGCTSGHGVCGIGAGARDAVVYTLAFMAAGVVTVLVWNMAS